MRRKTALLLVATLLGVMAGPFGLAQGRPAAAAQRQAAPVSDADVGHSIEMAKEWLINKAPDGVWHTGDVEGHSALALYTLAYIGEDPNGKFMTAAIDGVLAKDTERTYVRAIRCMAFSIIQKQFQKSGNPKRDEVRAALKADAKWLIEAQGDDGGWFYPSRHNGPGDFDLSNTQMAILGLWQAEAAGVEVPDKTWRLAQQKYYKLQNQVQGGWNYGNPKNGLGGNHASYGSMTAAGLASVYIIGDMLNLASGCPCRDGHSGLTQTEMNRRVDLALGWLSKNFVAGTNPGHGGEVFYWLYSAERVGLAAGYKYFGTHNWYREGAEFLVSRQGRDGAWGDLPATCFAALFLHKGRAPILYQKLDCGQGVAWDNHRRDLANLTAFIERTEETPVRWQITNLTAPLEELHDAPILYISTETPPQFTYDQKKKLRAFTDTGGTILVEASCGNGNVREWFTEFAKEVWPEWPLKPLGPDHPVYQFPNHLEQRPEIMGVDDGLRTCVFYAADDISCAWQTKGFASKEYVFLWGINLFMYATDKAPLRAQPDSGLAQKTEKYATVVKGGGKSPLSVARLKTDGDWYVGRNYKALDSAITEVAKRTGIGLRVDDNGADPGALGGFDAAYLVGSKEVTLGAVQRLGLKIYLEKGGFLWAEAACGSITFDRSFRNLATLMGWDLKPIPRDDPIMTGAFKKAVGYDISKGVVFRRVMKIPRAGRPWADLEGIYQDNKLVGIYSPFDAVMSATPYQVFDSKGYSQEDALAVITNIMAYLSDR